MPNPWTPISVKIGADVHTGSGESHAFHPTELELSWSWGLQPASAQIKWVSSNANLTFLPQAALTILAPGRVFYGLTEEWVRGESASEGTTITHIFQDSRRLLQYDSVVGAFNKRVERVENGQLLKYYEHILPIDAALNRKTTTTAPLTARQILDELFTAPTVKFPWARVYHWALNAPVYDVNFLSGVKLGQAVLQLSERCGTTFTLKGGRYTLEWCVKGEGLIPTVAQADNIRLGQKLSGHPSRITLLGERNLYQVLDVPMVKDWASGWEFFYDVFLLVQDICAFEVTEAAIADIPAGTAYTDIPGDDDLLIGWQLAFARAQTITVAQYADLVDARPLLERPFAGATGDMFRDYRKFCGRSRLHMPASIYIKALLFRAFRVDPTFVLTDEQGNQLRAVDLEIVETAIVEVTHDPGTGEMFWDAELKASANGYAIAQGYQLGSDAFRTINPEHFDFSKWTAHQELWQHVDHQLDDSGQGYQFILFDQPIIRSDTLLTVPTINGVLQGFPVLRADAVITSPNVRASLVFAGTRFRYQAGLPPIDEFVSEPGLQGQYVCTPAVLGTGWVVEEEIAYADGFTALERATLIMASLLTVPSLYTSGGCSPPVETGLQLNPVIDRITISYNARDGYTEHIDWTAERKSRAFEAERDFERKQSLLTLLPGEREARVTANQAKLFASGLRQNPEFVKTLMSAAGMLFGNESPTVVYVEN